ncbi:MAG: hypothetical protein AAF563_02090 [Pseudomonadota bacterium]
MTTDLDHSRINELRSLCVPDWACGVWRRAFGRYPGREDTTTTVIWIQTPTLYADIRVAAPDDPSPHARDEGFAGWLDVDDQVFTWHRPVDLHRRPEGGDKGAMFLDSDVMIEVGLLTNYMEEYHRIDRAASCFAASRGTFTTAGGKVRFSGDDPVDILVAAGPHVIHARHDSASALRYGRLDTHGGIVTVDLAVGDPSAFTPSDDTWTVWSDGVDEATHRALVAFTAT